ncbi:potassium channel family protein [Parenemella sanctibonifatiensis]|uniref:Trk system potassium uptake protein TrkA n=1 Tax=Parenemella sanctibonifatiensis TaxID=2016505 RepID=A0A255E4D0_9ACTN|nr:TrkA family potassium uptake protein [Parenemella sanctibonifatiensis]OYN86428.1 potassium transporter TrkA [Parenemella sanctibonifatiensis]
MRIDRTGGVVHIVIMGCGRLGSMLAIGLEKRGHSVAVIDQDPAAFRRLPDHFQGGTVEGIGFDRDVLHRAGIEHADGFAAVSSGDNSNILAARVVREEFQVENVVARIYDQGRAEVYERLGIPTVATIRWAARQVLRRLLPEGSEPVWRDPSGQVRLLQVHAHPDWIGARIGKLQERCGAPLPFILRAGTGMVPHAGTVFQAGDLLYAAVENDRVGEVETILGNPPSHRPEGRQSEGRA